jgi:hypothetical protein
MRGKPFKKGNPGKPKGAQNKTTKDIKEAYKLLIEKNLDNLTTWLERIAAKNPTQAIYIISDLSEYVIPKLARKEITGKDGKKIIVKIENDNSINSLINLS